MSGFFNKAKQAPEQAAAMTKEGVEDVQQRFEISQAYGELGKTAFELIESGEISHARLEGTAAKIRDLNGKPALSETLARPGLADRVSAYSGNGRGVA